MTIAFGLFCAMIPSPVVVPLLVRFVKMARPGAMVEEVTIPARFLAAMAHLLTVLTLLFDVENVVKRALDVDHTNSQYNKGKTDIVVLSTFSIVCFFVEVITTFSGITLFLHKVNCLNILLHFWGATLTILFLFQKWSLSTFGVIFGFCRVN
ncbi:hypothetical protein CBR_g31503 [Chara braunii]|uniref:Transmembrane protein 107 n=1 Tax=Chara braunii TaxID=69332 RepID=A0A388LF71_CHABU|nr:hypothetical protein CBR_g31503 [Chara braunii]|eukprot:GBG80946.1 hypothetical protein CBR_g31503 [Chara braunii]